LKKVPCPGKKAFASPKIPVRKKPENAIFRDSGKSRNPIPLYQGIFDCCKAVVQTHADTFFILEMIQK